MARPGKKKATLLEGLGPLGPTPYNKSVREIISGVELCALLLILSPGWACF